MILSLRGCIQEKNIVISLNAIFAIKSLESSKLQIKDVIANSVVKLSVMTMERREDLIPTIQVNHTESVTYVIKST